MTRTVLLVPTSPGVGLISVVWGVHRAIENQGIRVGLFKPFAKTNEHAQQWEHQNPMSVGEVESLLSKGEKDALLEELISRFEQVRGENDVIVAQGLVATSNRPYAATLNRDLALALDADVILVSTPKNYSQQQLSEEIEITARGFKEHGRLLGYIINKVGSPVDEKGETRLDLTADAEEEDKARCEKMCRSLDKKDLSLLGCIPWNPKLIAPRVKEIAEFLSANIVVPGDLFNRRVEHITLCAQSVHHMLKALKPGTLIITAGDRTDIILATCMAVINGVKISALVLTGGFPFKEEVKKLCEKALELGLPILSTKSDSFRTALLLQDLNVQVPFEDTERLELVKNEMAEHIETTWIQELRSKDHEPHLSPAAFRYALTSKARVANKKIILPEGNEPRIIKAAAVCVEKKLARCLLLGNESEIRQTAENTGVSLDPSIEIIDPTSIAKNYIEPMVALRKHKGVTEVIAEEHLKDPVVLATMMLQQGEVDGLVSGATHSTANTIRPALQLIKTAPNSSLVSSIFFMLLPDQVLVYGDCAVNPDPTAEELADIAMQCADSATLFGIPPRVAMISYSSGSSGSGSNVEKVAKATSLVKEKRPDILIDGPLQYDAASTMSVAKKKAPDSAVAGRATVFVFPDLNTGNTTYKAVQRSADVLSIGPMLQGLAKPVNDLSRGALVEDIVFTIALTALQSIE